MFHTCAIKGSGYRPVMASRHGQPCGATGPVRQVPAAGQKHLSLGTRVGGLALGSKPFTVRRFIHVSGQSLLCLGHAGHVCSLWVVFQAGDVHGRTAPGLSEVEVEQDVWVWNWISVARPEWALKYLRVRDLLSYDYIHISALR